MKIRSLALIALVFFAAQARADQLATLAQQVANEVSASERFLNPSQQSQIGRHLDQIRAILNGDLPQPGNPYSCVSRDNDGSRPFMIGYKDFANVIRIPGTVIGDKEACESAITKARRVFNRLFLCGTKDNDGSRPYAVLSLNGKDAALKLQGAVASSLEDCAAIVNGMQVRREGVLYCASKDNDGYRPYAKYGYRFDGSFEKGNETYSTLAECLQNL